MAKRFEDLRIWQEARQLNRKIFALSDSLIERRRLSLENQITRASLSVMNNIAEGFDRGGNREFRHYLIQSKGSTGEVKSMLYVVLDERFLNDSDFQALYERYDRLGGGIHRLIEHLSGSDFEGTSRRPYPRVEETPEEYEISLDPDELNRFWIE